MAKIVFNIRADVENRIPTDAGARLNQAMGQAIVAATAMLYTMAYQNIPVRTGRTRSTIEHVALGVGGPHVTGMVGSDDTIAWFLEYSTRPHRIFPVVKKALWWPGLARPIEFADHPGTIPYLWLTRAGPPAGDFAKTRLAAAFASVFG